MAARANLFPQEAVSQTQPAAAPAIAIIAVATQPLARDLLPSLLRRVAPEARCQVTDGAAPVTEACDVVVIAALDDWRRALAWLDEARPSAPVVLLTGDADPEMVGEALRRGVRGIVPTTTTPEVAAAALQLVLSGGTFVPAGVIRDTAPPPPKPRTADDDAAVSALGFTRRETQVLQLLRRGRSNRDIAIQLGISESTVVVHVRHLMQKLSATNRAEAVYMIHQRLREARSATLP